METTANELANKHRLSRKTLSVQRDPKRDNVVVVEEISCSGTEHPRSETYYKMYNDVPTENMNALLARAKNDATLEFLGLPLGTVAAQMTETVELVEAKVEIQIDKPKVVRKRRASPPKAKAALAQAKAIEKEVEEQVVVDKVIAEAAKVVDVVAAVVAPEVIYEAPADEVKKEVENITYSKTSREHINLLRPLIQESFGKDWKKDDNSRVAVREVVAKLNGKVAVTDHQGIPLPSFTVVAQEVIDTIKDIDL